MLDADAVIGLASGHPRLVTRFRQHGRLDFGLSAIVFHELSFGAFRSVRQTENLQRLAALRFEILDFDREDARRAGEVRAHLAAAGMPIGPYDVLIAGQALARGLILITHNIREFSRVAGLQVEDWQG